MSGARPSVLVLDGSSQDLSLLGGKGASLDQLLSWDMPVPPTGVVTTDAYRSFVDAPALGALIGSIRDGAASSAESIDEAFVGRCSAFPSRDEVAELALRVGGVGGRLAIRSSATVEDLAASSFAGQYTSVLDVDAADPDEVMAAVARVFASLWHPAPCAYRRAFGISEDDVAMAAVVMRMVPARRAGVVFTTDPGGRPGAARVEVVEGLAESLVSGQRTPDAFVVDRVAPVGLDDEVATALELALRIESLSGRPQDVEWAWDGSTTLVVQARPITVTAGRSGDGFDSPMTDDELTTAAIGETLPGVLPPLVWQLSSHLVDEAFRRVLDDVAALPPDGPDGLLVRRVRGRAALDFSQLRAMADALGGDTGEHLEQQYFGSRRPGRPTTQRPIRRRPWPRTVLHDLRVLSTRRRVVQDADAVAHAAGLVVDEAPDLVVITDEKVLGYRSRLVDLATRAMADELAVAAVAVSGFGRFESMLVPHLGVDVAAAAAEHLTSAAGVTVLPRATASAAVFAGPTWAELGLEPGGRPRTSDERSDAERLRAAVAELEGELGASPAWGGDALRHHLRATALRRTAQDVVEQLRRRERTKVAVLALGGEVRRVHLELGRRLTDRGALDAPTDVELLSDAELRRALEGSPPPAASLASRRRWLDRYEAEGPLPARFTGAPDRTVVELPHGRRLEGWATSAGRSTGIAQVVRSATGRLEPGRVLVAEATDASWAPLFIGAAGIVLERGGPLSHAAILARELGVPAVLNVAGATRLLDGQEVTVDGDAGIVVLTDAEVPTADAVAT